MKCKVFLTSMGWGHAMRSMILLKELLRVFPKLQITIQGNNNLEFFEKNLKRKINFIKDENLIKFYFNKKGEIDYNLTSRHFKNYRKKSENWIKKNLYDKDYDFFISDISPEGIQVAHLLGKPIFGICHFTWDWFGLKLKEKIIHKSIIKKWVKYQKNVTKFFFPPLTPNSVLKKYPNHIKVPFLSLDKKIKVKNIPKKKKILFLDSGENLYGRYFKDVIKKNENNKEITIMHSENLGKLKNTFIIKKKYLLTDFIKYTDYIFARPGFNTITSILRNYKPTTIISDRKNPEMIWNAYILKKMKIVKVSDINSFKKNFNHVINNKIVASDIKKKQKQINKKFKFNGQKFIVNKIKNLI